MEIKLVDPRALVEKPRQARPSKSNPQAVALLLATIKAVGIVRPPVVAPQAEGGNGFVIQAGHRRPFRQAIAAGLEEIAVIVGEAAEDGGAMRSLVETLAHEGLNPRRRQ